MAKKSKQDELFEMLRARGLRKRVARTIADAADKGGSAAPKSVQKSVADLRALAADLEDRVSGGPGKRKAAAQKAAATRKRAAAKRSTAAKKAATTRARKSVHPLAGAEGGSQRAQRGAQGHDGNAQHREAQHREAQHRCEAHHVAQHGHAPRVDHEAPQQLTYP